MKFAVRNHLWAILLAAVFIAPAGDTLAQEEGEFSRRGADSCLRSNPSTSRIASA